MASDGEKKEGARLSKHRSSNAPEFIDRFRFKADKVSSDSSSLPSTTQTTPNASVSGPPSGKVEISEAEYYHATGFMFPTWKKWSILVVIFAVQTSMNFNAAVYGNNISHLSNHFNVSAQAARVGQMIFLVAYAFGCELWAPWSEEYGRWTVLQLSLFFVNIFQLPVALAPNFATVVVGRFFGGLSSAGGSVTLGMVADMWQPHEQGYAVAFIVFSSVAGSLFGPITGGFIETHLNWNWNAWIQLFFGVAVQAIHFWVPETRSTILLDREAKRLRKSGLNIWGPNEMNEKRITRKKVVQIWFRPFVMFVTEPIVLFLSLLSGFSDALIFTFLASYGLVYAQWGFSSIQTGLAFIPLGIGYILAYIFHLPFIHKDRQILKRDLTGIAAERRLYPLLWLAPLLSLGMFGFAWTSLGPPQVHWIAPMLFSILVGAANYSIYMGTIDYMVASYGPYSSSATGGNGFARDFLAGIAAMYSVPLFTNISETNSLEWASTLLGCFAIILTIPIYVFYRHGESIRKRSKFASKLAEERQGHGGLMPFTVGHAANANHLGRENSEEKV
ncbi:putative MFS multidrug transporter [Patellaria atrata CBS 101060]|uniref:MFS multidrug transporter n=1 Tax=Patellaria atrata CBS 101060 TaxID=1346257 RepID=A0A9P4SDQ7_9PEZI|nr:putative MFS multidrug transporter [Patellaria atrata CBS 101060]